MSSEAKASESFHTADLFDSAPDRFIQIDLPFRHFSRRIRFSGRCSTIVAGSDPVTIKEAVEEPGEGRVLVIDGGGSNLACLGDKLSERAMVNGWAGAVLIGAVRDTATLAIMDFGIVALRPTALRPFGREPGRRDVALEAGRVTIRPGDMIFVDSDAVLVEPAG